MRKEKKNTKKRTCDQSVLVFGRQSDDDNNKGGGVKSVVVPLDFANEVEENIIVFFERRILTRREM